MIFFLLLELFSGGVVPPHANSFSFITSVGTITPPLFLISGAILVAGQIHATNSQNVTSPLAYFLLVTADTIQSSKQVRHAGPRPDHTIKAR
jgi:hypothetical protein